MSKKIFIKTDDKQIRVMVKKFEKELYDLEQKLYDEIENELKKVVNN